MKERTGPNGPSEKCDGLFFYLGDPAPFMAAPLVHGKPNLEKAWPIFSRNHGGDQLGIERRRRYREIRHRLIEQRWNWRPEP